MSNNQDAKQPSKINKRRLVDELRLPKKLKKSKVKQVVSMFNAMITHIMKRDSVTAGKYVALVNEVSPQPKRLPRATRMVPVPMPRTFNAKPRTPVPTPRKKTLTKIQSKPSACFVAEDVFQKLSVKEKAHLYSKFVEEIYKKNSIFNKHPRPIEANKEKNTERGEVIVEKQVSVKALLEEFEFNAVFPKTSKSQAKALQRRDSMKRALAARRNGHEGATNGKEFTENHQKKRNSLPHLHTLVTTQLHTKQLSHPNITIFQNQELEKLFFSWFKEKHENDMAAQSIPSQSKLDGKNLKPVTDKVLKVAVESDKNYSVLKSLKLKANLSTVSSMAKTSETEESESGLSSLPKNTSEDSQPESQQTKSKNSENDFEFVKPVKPVRKKKLRKNLPLKKDASVKETTHSTTTDSESDTKQTETKPRTSNAQSVSQEVIVVEQTPHKLDETMEELDESLIKMANSPRKIKSVYTLTVLDTPMCTPRTSLNVARPQPFKQPASHVTQTVSLGDSLTDQGFETATNDTDSPRRKIPKIPSQAEIKNPSAVFTNKNNFGFSTPVVAQKVDTLATMPSVKKQLFSPILKPLKNVPVSLTKKSLDLSTSIKSQKRHSFAAPPSAKLQSYNPIFNSPKKSSEPMIKRKFNFSTPIVTPERHSFAASTSLKQQFLSPLSKLQKNRRKSIFDFQSKRNSLVKQVIKEDQLFEPQPTCNSEYDGPIEQKNLTIDATREKPKTATKLFNEKTSNFWIKCGDFSVTLEINYSSAERVRSLYKIFMETSCDNKDLHFGIDNNKFSAHEPLDVFNSSTRAPTSKRCSHYWFSSGDLAIPFSGKYMSAEKIQRLFRVIKETVQETGVLSFGVDEVEFSNVSEFWFQQPKFSAESQYSMLVGLQSGESNGLEGRSKYAWPHSKSMLTCNENEIDIFDEIECSRLSYVPFERNYNDLASLGNEDLCMPRNSLAMMNLESYCGEYESEPLDQLFDNSFNPEHRKQWEETRKMSLPKVCVTMQNEKQRLSKVQKQLASCVKPSFKGADTLDAVKGTPEYLQKLKSIVSNICNIGSSNNFQECSVEELEDYLQYLSRYAEICLKTCDKHMDSVLNALVDYKAVVV